MRWRICDFKTYASSIIDVRNGLCSYYGQIFSISRWPEKELCNLHFDWSYFFFSCLIDALIFQELSFSHRNFTEYCESKITYNSTEWLSILFINLSCLWSHMTCDVTSTWINKIYFSMKYEYYMLYIESRFETTSFISISLFIEKSN